MPGSTRSYEFAKRLTNNGNSVHIITSNWQNKLSDKNFQKLMALRFIGAIAVIQTK